MGASGAEKRRGTPARHGWEEAGTPEPLDERGGDPRAEEAGGSGSTDGDGRTGRDNAVAAPAKRGAAGSKRGRAA